MANSDAPQGLTPYRHQAGGVIRESGAYRIASGTSSNIFRGDLVKLLSTGYLAVAAAGDTDLIGVFNGCSYVDANGNQIFSPYWPASATTLGSADVQAYVYDDPNVTYMVQSDSTTNSSLTHVGNNADMISTHAGSALTGQSGQEIDLAAAGSGTANLRVIGLVEYPDNAFGQHSKLEVLINEHKYRTATGV